MDFTTAINNIRNAIYGKEVRESLAVMGEYLEGYFKECASKIGDAIQSAKDAEESAVKAEQALSDTLHVKEDAVSAINTTRAEAQDAIENQTNKSLTSVANATADSETAAQNAQNSADAAARSEQVAGEKAEAAEASANAAEQSEKRAEEHANKAAAAVSTDKTLSIEGVPADAKATGDMVNYIKLKIATSVTKNPFEVSFATLDNVAVAEGVWNVSNARIEF